MPKAIGTKAEVYRGAAKMTPGGLTKSKLTVSKNTGKVISKAQKAAGKRLAAYAHGGAMKKKGRRGGYFGMGALYSAAPIYV